MTNSQQSSPIEQAAKEYAGVKVPLGVKDYSAATKRVFNAFIAGSQWQAKQVDTELRWVKASDRLPEVVKPYHCKDNGRLKVYTVGDIRTLKDISNIEWLEETPAQPTPESIDEIVERWKKSPIVGEPNAVKGETDNIVGTFEFDHEKMEETYTENPNFGKPKASPKGDDVEVLKECDEYLSHETYENGKPVHLNSIGAYSVLHQKIKRALSKAAPKGDDVISKEDAETILKNIQHHIDTWSDEPERALRLVGKEIFASQFAAPQAGKWVQAIEERIKFLKQLDVDLCKSRWNMELDSNERNLYRERSNETTAIRHELEALLNHFEGSTDKNENPLKSTQ